MPLQQIASRCLPACLLLAVLATASAQTPGSVQIAVVEGQGAQNPTAKAVGSPIVVELRDASGAPIPRAEVTFRSPNDGPSATFFGASHVSKAWTDENGRAEAAALTPNTIPGAYTILVEANHQGATARAEIQQTNVAAEEPVQKKRRFGKKIWIPIAAGIVVVIVGLAQRD